jgi:hypothetical protein
MLADATLCMRLTSSDYKDIGVGTSGNVYVAAFGSER